MLQELKNKPPFLPFSRKFDAVVIGVSAGGMEALSVILPALPSDFPAPVIVVQHISPDSDNYIVTYLSQRCRIHIKEADEKDDLVKGTVYFAPPNYHLLVEEDRTLSLSVEDRVNFSRPSIDILFETAADAYGPALVGVVLTGANRDGSMGLRRIRELGGLALVQSPETAQAGEMPRAAIEAADAEHILPLKQIGPFLCRLFGMEHES